MEIKSQMTNHKPKVGYLICNLGSTGTGKSKLIDDMINKGVKVLVFDFQNEYTIPTLSECHKSKNYNQIRFPAIDHTIEEFMDFVKAKGINKGYTVVIEEATGVFSSHRSKEFEVVILSKRHYLTHFILNFHSLHKVPPFIVDYTDAFVLRKTMDFEKNVKSKFPKIYDDWEKIQLSENIYEKKVIYWSSLTKY